MRTSLPHLPLSFLVILATTSELPIFGSAAPTQLLRQEPRSDDVIAAAAAADPSDATSPTNIDAYADDDAIIDLEEEGSLLAMQFTSDPHANRDHKQMILNGELFLSAIRYSPHSFPINDNDNGHVDNNDQYDSSSVYGEFCAYDPSINRRDPPKYPTHGAVVSSSEHCGEHAYLYPLHEIVQYVNEHDATTHAEKIRHLPLAGMLFHVGYAGAGLVSNVLTSFESNLVVSEHGALSEALAACDVVRNRYKKGDDECSSEKQMRLVLDIVHLLSRTPDLDVRRMYLKLSSSSAAYLSEMTSLYPAANWAFVYRNPEHALAKAVQGRRHKACNKFRRNPSFSMKAKSNEREVDLESLSSHEVCAFHLSNLFDVAFHEHQQQQQQQTNIEEDEKKPRGMLLSYDDDIVTYDTDRFMDVILPHFGLQEEIDANPQGVRDRISEILSMRSSTIGRPNPDHRWWGGESVDVSAEVGAASSKFMGDTMESIVGTRK